MAQYTSLRAKGVSNPNPRKQFLHDILTVIRAQRSKGFRPILMMDAHGDYTSEKQRDKDLGRFISEAGLVDPLWEKLGYSPRTYTRGRRRLDYILMDRGLCPSIKAIGNLGTHEAADSDHVLLYVDFDERRLFSGLINRPPTQQKDS